MNTLSKHTLFFIATLFLSQVQASNFSGVSYFDFSYVDKKGGVFDVTRTYLGYANKLSHKKEVKVALSTDPVSGEQTRKFNEETKTWESA